MEKIMQTSISKREFLRSGAMLSLGTGVSMFGAGSVALAQSA